MAANKSNFTSENQLAILKNLFSQLIAVAKNVNVSIFVAFLPFRLYFFTFCILSKVLHDTKAITSGHEDVKDASDVSNCFDIMYSIGKTTNS